MITEAEKVEAARSWQGLHEKHPVRRAIEVILRDCEEEIGRKLGDETIGGDQKLQVAGQFGGVRLVREALAWFGQVNFSDDEQTI